MPRTQVPTREGPKKEISTPIEKKNRPYTMGSGGNYDPRGSREELLKKQFDGAVDALSKLNDASAVETMQMLPLGLLEMYLLAEETHRARPMVLRAFPKPGRLARERYLGAASPEAKSKHPKRTPAKRKSEKE